MKYLVTAFACGCLISCKNTDYKSEKKTVSFKIAYNVSMDKEQTDYDIWSFDPDILATI